MPVCSKCGDDKPEEAFAYQSVATGKRRTCCRQCAAVLRRLHYLRERSTYIENERLRVRRHRELNRALIIEYLHEHPCVDCGESDPVLLEFDHRDPNNKRLEVAHLARKKPWPQVLAEIDKCDVRCVSCHRRRTAHQFGWRRTTLSARSQERPPEKQIGPRCADASHEVRTCRTCKIPQTIAEFAIKNVRTGRRSTQCRTCDRAYAKQHYVKNRSSYMQRTRRNKKEHRDRTALLILDHLRTHPCVDCGETDVVLLEFDHRDRSTKSGNVGDLVGRGTRKELIAELEKCDVRCVRCHRIKTAKEFGWRRLAEDVIIYRYAGVA